MPLKIRDVEFKNRIWMSPMCQYSAQEGVPQDWHMVHYGSRAAGGVGLVMIEATGVLPEGRISPGCTGLWSKKQAQAFQPIVDFVHAQNCRIGIQLAHAGRKAATAIPWKGGKPLAHDKDGWRSVAPSAIAFADGYQIPQQLDEKGMQNIVEGFVNAAKLADQVGFDVIELHMAHGYLLHSFLSPISNQRSDEYGGAFNNRIQFPVQVASVVRENWPVTKPLFVRLSCTDWVPGAWDLEQSIEFARVLQSLGVDLIDCSSGGTTLQAKIPQEPLYQVEFATKIREKTGVLTSAVGLITMREQINDILQSGKADAVFLGRELLRNPYFPLHLAKQVSFDIPWPHQYNRAKN